MSVSRSHLQEEYPLHWAVFVNDECQLAELLQKDGVDIEKLDCRGRTPLLLAVTMGHVNCAELLLKKGANADAHNRGMWSVSHEAVSLGQPELLRDVITHRDHQRSMKGAQSMRDTLNKLKDSPDFYTEMSWEFSSWIPFLSQSCPSDTYKIYKQGSNVRIDTTLIAFESSNWVRGNQSFIFRINDGFAEFVVLDHDAKTAAIQSLRDDVMFEEFSPTDVSIDFRLSTPISTTYIDVDQIGFERSKGFMSWFSGADSENVDGHECKILTASNVQLITKKRTEHLSSEDRLRIKQEENASSKVLSGFMKMLQTERTDEGTTVNLFDDENKRITAVEYLDSDFSFSPGSDIGRPREVLTKSNAFKSTLWMAQSFPLSLQEQVVPIVELMAANSPHFARLHNFIRLQLPAGFPVKIEIPLFRVISAKISFLNINKPGQFVTPLEPETSTNTAPSVVIDDAVFEIPSTYSTLDEEVINITWNNDGPTDSSRLVPDENRMLQLAIEQSVRSAGQGGEVSDEQLARTLQEQYNRMFRNQFPDDDLVAAIQLSREEELQRRRLEMEKEEEEVKLAIELSLKEN